MLCFLVSSSMLYFLVSQAVKPLVNAALAISDLVKITGRTEPTVIT